MNSITTKAVVLNRTNYGEADRIITALTEDSGKLRLMVRGVRKEKSKLAGGIELFSVNDITFIKGKSELHTVISARMIRSYSNILKDLDRVQFGYDLLKLINRVTEDQTDPAYFNLVNETFKSLDSQVSLQLVHAWFLAQLLKLYGLEPNLKSDLDGDKLEESNKYSFDIDRMALSKVADGKLGANEIKALRLLFGDKSPEQLNVVNDIDDITATVQPVIASMVKNHLV